MKGLAFPSRAQLAKSNGVSASMKPMTLRLTLMLAAAAILSGCGVAGAPARGTAAVVHPVPVVGLVVAAPLDVTADVID